MINRRNYYRILHVQPDAPLAVIKSSYRTLMQTLKGHPDLGGDEWNASVVNEAFAVLSDEVKRANYDALLKAQLTDEYQKSNIKKNLEENILPTPSQPNPSNAKLQNQSGYLLCPFCHIQQADPRFRMKELSTTCGVCQCPLISFSEDERSHWRRFGDRIPFDAPVRYYSEWPGEEKYGRLKNISPTGIAIIVDEVEAKNKLLLVHCDVLHCSAIVKRAESFGARHSTLLGLEFVTVAFEQTQGLFLSAEV